MVIIVAIAVAAATAIALTSSKSYAAEAGVLVTPAPAANTDLFGLGLVPQSGDPTRDAETVARLITTNAVAQRVRARLHLRQSARSLLDDVSAQPVAQSSIVTVTATASDPSLAARLANGFVVAAMAEQTDRLHALLDSIIPQLRRQLDAVPAGATGTADALRTRLQALESLRALRDPTLHLETRATPPASAASPRPTLIIAAAFAAGLILAIAAVLGAHLFDPRIEREDDLGRYRIPVLGRIPLESRGRRLGRHTPFRPDELSPSARDAFHRLASSLAGRTNGKSAVLVTGAAPGDGKTTTAVNLAASLAARQERVLLVEGDSRRPSIATAFGLDAAGNLSDVVTGRLPLNDAADESDRLPAGIRVILADPADPAAPAPVSPEAAEQIVGEARLISNWLVVDAPALNYAPDLLPLAKRVDSVLLVVRLRSTRVRDLSDLAELLTQQGITPDGFIVIGGKARPSYHQPREQALQAS